MQPRSRITTNGCRLGKMGDYTFPDFHRYPPYFTLQPVESTRDKQAQLWRELIRKYCEWNRKYVISVDADAEDPLFANAEIDRKLDRNARVYFLNEMVKHGEAEVIDKKKTKFLIFWKRTQEWADLVLQWVRGIGDGTSNAADDSRVCDAATEIPRSVLMHTLCRERPSVSETTSSSEDALDAVERTGVQLLTCLVTDQRRSRKAG
eukprot:scaffold80_cov325-Pavlova_lutheri.AAC.41